MKNEKINMELKPNMYVRTDKGEIGKIIKIDEGYKGKLLYFFDIDLPNYAHIEEEFLKASNNIIDLIEVGDYVNGEKVIALKKYISERNIHMNSKGNSIFVDYDLANDWYYGIDDEEIKSIVTKEQFESMEYKVNE